MPTDKHVTVYVDLQNVDEVKSLMQDAATQIGALRAAGEELAEAIRDFTDPLAEGAGARVDAALARWDALQLIDGSRCESETP